MTRRAFSIDDQRHFADITGDRNPIHVDPLAARRTVAGEPIVHGVHMLLWALDVAAAEECLPSPSRMHVSFLRFLPVGEPASARIARRAADRLEVEVVADGTVRCTIGLVFGAVPVPAAAPTPAFAADAPLIAPDTPVSASIATMAGLTGRVPPAAPASALAELFPAAARWLGAERLAALGACTRLVGMICPGLHSLFSGLSILLGPLTDDGTIGFAVGAVRHGLVTIDVVGSGIAGRITAVVRAAPRRQPAMADLAPQVPGRPFAGQRALVAGGSRGLGELAAKLLAAGGAEVVVTWSAGEADATAVAADIRGADGRCETLRYRIGEPLDLAALSGEPPTHGYYFAAPTIARPASRFFDADRLTKLQHFFVDGFWRFALALRERRADVRIFYPSTTYVTDWPRGLAEYAMAKAAGEILCAEMNGQLAPTTIVSARLPRLATDQTAGVVEVETSDPVAILLPLIRDVQRRPV